MLFQLSNIVEGRGKPPMNNSKMNLAILVITLVTLTQNIHCSGGPQGVFEIRLKKFHNSRAMTENGECCEGVRQSNGQCSGHCNTKFRVCLKHYQNQIDLNQGCTFGEEITTVLGSNNLSMSRRPPIKFDINFKWPVSNYVN